MSVEDTINDLKDIINKRILTETECDVLWEAIEYLNDVEYLNDYDEMDYSEEIPNEDE